MRNWQHSGSKGTHLIINSSAAWHEGLEKYMPPGVNLPLDSYTDNERLVLRCDMDFFVTLTKHTYTNKAGLYNGFANIN